MSQDLSRAMYENAVGKLVVDYLESLGNVDLPALAEYSALKLVAEVKAILDDDGLEDPACFRRIDALVDAFHAGNVPTHRHD